MPCCALLSLWLWLPSALADPLSLPCSSPTSGHPVRISHAAGRVELTQIQPVCRGDAPGGDVIAAIACSLPLADPAWVLQTDHPPSRDSGARTAHIEWLRAGKRLGASVIVHASRAGVETAQDDPASGAASEEEEEDEADAVQAAFAIEAVAEQAWLWPPKTPTGGSWNLRLLQGVVEVWISADAEEPLVTTARIIGAAISAHDAQSMPPRASARTVVVELHYAWPAEDDNEFSVRLGERVLCRVPGPSSMRPEDGTTVRGVCPFQLPPGNDQIEIRGRYDGQRWDRATRSTERVTVRGQQRLFLRDVSALTAPLRDAGLPWRERWTRSIEAEQALVEEYGGDQMTAIGEPLDESELKSAEARLGMALPQGYRDLIGAVGRVEFAASRWSSGDIILPPQELRTGEQTLLSWGYGEHGQLPAWIPPAAVEHLRRSVVLFIEHGDGMGAQLVRVPDDGAEGFIETAHLHEEWIGPAMDRLATVGLRRMQFDDLIVDLHARCVLGRLQSDVPATELLFDFSAPRERFELRAGGDPPEQFQVALERVQFGWDGLR